MKFPYILLNFFFKKNSHGLQMYCTRTASIFWFTRSSILYKLKHKISKFKIVPRVFLKFNKLKISLNKIDKCFLLNVFSTCSKHQIAYKSAGIRITLLCFYSCTFLLYQKLKISNFKNVPEIILNTIKRQVLIY